jgi:endonuclease/exonuclease/phosphatase family metal-dependent hydrolase
MRYFVPYLPRVSVFPAIVAASLAFSDLSAQTTNLNLRVMSANLNGNVQSYQPFALRIFQGLKPDVVAIQEFNYTSTNGLGVNTPAAFREMLDTAFGTNFVYFRETNNYNIPNGIISRYPIGASGEWDDSLVSDRGFAWAQIHLPGTNDLYVVSVHLYSSGTATDRNTEATTIKNQIQASFPANAWVIVAGDFNTSTRSEPAIGTFTTFLSDNPIPTDAEAGGDADTNDPRNKPYDYVLPSFPMTNRLTNVVLTSRSFSNGLVFDSRVYTPLSDVAPVQSGDSSNAQHMAVVKDFRLVWSVTNSTVPFITAQPQGQTVAPGSNANFTVTANGAGTLVYQWQFNGTDISAATTSSFTRTNAQSGDAGNYAVVITNSSGSVTSSAAILIVGIPPSITNQPSSTNADPGDSVSFSVGATGDPAPAYQWRFNGTSIAGATASTLMRTNVQAADTGGYTVVATNVAGAVTSSVATLALNNAPSITSQPQNQTISVGQAALFSVAAAGTAPLSYQWRFYGSNIPGAIASSYTRTNSQTSNAGPYTVVVSNALGTITSSVATLTVISTQPTIIAQWNFNSTVPDANVGTGVTTPSIGAGTASFVGGVIGNSPPFATGDTGFDPAPAADNSAWNTTAYPAVTSNNKTGGVRFDVSTTGKQNIVVYWSQRASATASKYARLQYSTNGTAFVDFPTAVAINAATVFEVKTNSLTAITGVDNNPNFAFRIVAEFESTASPSGGTNAYVPASSTSSYGTSGTERFDMLTVIGVDIPPTTPAFPALLSGVTFNSSSQFQFTVTGTVGSNYVVQTATNLAAPVWISVFTNTSPFVFTETAPPAASRYYRAIVAQ